jgi:hypothetical protein
MRVGQDTVYPPNQPWSWPPHTDHFQRNWNHTRYSCVERSDSFETTVSFSLFSFSGLTREALNCRHGRGLAHPGCTIVAWPALIILFLMLLLIVLSLHPRLSYGLHARCCSRLLKWHTPTMSCWKSRRSCSSRGLPWKQVQQGLSNAEWWYKTVITHIDLHADMPRHAALYTLCYLHTHIHTYIQREGRVLRFGVVLCL